MKSFLLFFFCLRIDGGLPQALRFSEFKQVWGCFSVRARCPETVTALTGQIIQLWGNDWHQILGFIPLILGIINVDDLLKKDGFVGCDQLTFLTKSHLSSNNLIN